jgi:nucleotide-binding universal stress UspA family protein
MRVLFATDGSDDAKAAAAWVDRLPLPPGREIMVLVVVTVPLVPTFSDVGEFRSALIADARMLADDTATMLVHAGSRAIGRVVEGDPRHEIVEAAETWKADLIVLGARGLGAIKEFLLGSVSLGVARHARCPVLVCKGTPRPIEAVTVAVDGSEPARHALDWLVSLPLPAGMRLQLVGVAEPQHTPLSGPGVVRDTMRAAAAAIEAERRASAEKECAAAAERVRGAELRVEIQIQTGRPADVIVREAQEDGSDLVVVGARGLGAMERLLLGSVSESVLRHAHCPVLVVRPRAAKE